MVEESAVKKPDANMLMVTELPVEKVAMGMSSCRCDMLFCMTHRLPEAHNCRYDFRGNHLVSLKDQ